MRTTTARDSSRMAKSWMREYGQGLEEVGEDDGGHGLDDDGGTQGKADVVPALDAEGVLTVFGEVPGTLRLGDAGGGLEGDAEVDILSVRNAALDATAIVCSGRDATLSIWFKDVVLFAASTAGTSKAKTIFEAFHSIDTEHGST